MNNPGFSALQRSKKILIFTYLFFIAVFVTLSVAALYMKSAHFSRLTEMELGTMLASNGFARCFYKGFSGDLLSEIEITGFRAEPASHDAGRLFASAAVRSVKLTLFPLRHLFSYASLSSVPADISVSGVSVATGSDTIETNFLFVKTASSRNFSSGTFEVSFKAGADVTSDQLQARLPEPLSAEGTVAFGPSGSPESARVRLAAGKISVSPRKTDMSGRPLKFEVRGLTAEIGLAPSGRLFASPAAFELLKGSFTFPVAEYDRKAGKARIRGKVSGLDSETFFREFPCLPFMVLTRRLQAAFEFEGSPSDARGGEAGLSVTMDDAAVVEHAPGEGKTFAPVGFGDFVTSLGLTPEIAHKARSIKMLARLSGRKISIRSLEIDSDDYKFTASATAFADDRIEGDIKLHIVKRVLQNNTLAVDFSSMDNGLTITGLVCGTIEKPFVIYNMDRASLLKITGDLMMKKMRDYFGGAKK